MRAEVSMQPEPARSATERNKALIWRLNAEVINAGRVELLDELYAEDLVHERRGLITTMTLLRPAAREAGPDLAPRDRFRLGYATIHAGFPDWHSVIESMVAEGDTVVVRYRVTGTNSAPFLGRPATGRRVDVSEIVYFTFRHGRIARIWAASTELDLWLQLGVVEPPRQEHAMTSTTDQIAETAGRIRAAVQSGDPDRMRAVMADDAQVWENTHGTWIELAKVLAFHGTLAADLPSLTFDNVRVTATQDGYVDQHTKHFVLPEGSEYFVDTCLVVQLRDGKLWRAEEYMDSAQKPPGTDPSAA